MSDKDDKTDDLGVDEWPDDEFTSLGDEDREFDTSSSTDLDNDFDDFFETAAEDKTASEASLKENAVDDLKVADDIDDLDDLDMEESEVLSAFDDNEAEVDEVTAEVMDEEDAVIVAEEDGAELTVAEEAVVNDVQGKEKKSLVDQVKSYGAIAAVVVVLSGFGIHSISSVLSGIRQAPAPVIVANNEAVILGENEILSDQNDVVLLGDPDDEVIFEEEPDYGNDLNNELIEAFMVDASDDVYDGTQGFLADDQMLAENNDGDQSSGDSYMDAAAEEFAADVDVMLVANNNAWLAERDEFLAQIMTLSARFDSLENELQQAFESLDQLLMQQNEATQSVSYQVDQSMDLLGQDLDRLSSNVYDLSTRLIDIESREVEQESNMPLVFDSTLLGGYDTVGYTVRAAIPGRAWLVDPQGEMLTAKVGTRIVDHGYVVDIAPADGTVTLDSGLVIRE